MERASLILELLKKESRATVDQLVEHLKASPASVRRDLTALEREGKLIRVHGGAMLAPEHKGELNFLTKRKTATQAKQAMAKQLELLIPAGSTVFLDGGSTVYEAACALLSSDAYRVYTNSLPILELARTRGRSISIIGGTLRQPSLAMVGSLAARWLEALWFDFAILGASGLHAKNGAFTTEPEEAAIKRKAALQSERRVLLADATKWEKQASVGFLEWTEISDWIVDTGLPEKCAKTLQTSFGVEVIRA